MNRIVVCCAAAALAFGVVACSNSQTTAGRDTAAATTGSPVPPPAPGTPVITISGMGYSAPITVAPGAQITIVNDDEVAHTVTSRTKGLFDVHVGGKQRALLTAPADPGEYGFVCTYHPAMVSNLTVK
ncbi:plastocyanin [Mycobacterium sp. 852013-50091_SCH5140682]|uniref:cupredoxin domain-containing protein n=1 Tax=Mycobacterium sp. 852013-50091_SCH5140682 TaxID=1834109 RepID=UPI0007EA4B11|nr:cupredoxin domain-containing protein [Mycobacterium sp. 852013-50091_SCH5140682]OBC06222.1 plastocyanin [Mycobacterium sp. 852013-50091_SCH5140682]